MLDPISSKLICDKFQCIDNKLANINLGDNNYISQYDGSDIPLDKLGKDGDHYFKNERIEVNYKIDLDISFSNGDKTEGWTKEFIDIFSEYLDVHYIEDMNSFSFCTSKTGIPQNQDQDIKLENNFIAFWFYASTEEDYEKISDFVNTYLNKILINDMEIALTFQYKSSIDNVVEKEDSFCIAVYESDLLNKYSIDDFYPATADNFINLKALDYKKIYPMEEYKKLESKWWSVKDLAFKMINDYVKDSIIKISNYLKKIEFINKINSFIKIDAEIINYFMDGDDYKIITTINIDPSSPDNSILFYDKDFTLIQRYSGIGSDSMVNIRFLKFKNTEVICVPFKNTNNNITEYTCKLMDKLGNIVLDIISPSQERVIFQHGDQLIMDNFFGGVHAILNDKIFITGFDTEAKRLCVYVYDSNGQLINKLVNPDQVSDSVSYFGLNIFNYNNNIYIIESGVLLIDGTEKYGGIYKYDSDLNLIGVSYNSKVFPNNNYEKKSIFGNVIANSNLSQYENRILIPMNYNLKYGNGECFVYDLDLPITDIEQNKLILNNSTQNDTDYGTVYGLELSCCINKNGIYISDICKNTTDIYSVTGDLLKTLSGDEGGGIYIIGGGNEYICGTSAYKYNTIGMYILDKEGNLIRNDEDENKLFFYCGGQNFKSDETDYILINKSIRKEELDLGYYKLNKLPDSEYKQELGNVLLSEGREVPNEIVTKINELRIDGGTYGISK